MPRMPLILAAMVLALLLSATASATSTVYIQYLYNSDPTDGNWYIPSSPSGRASMCGPWNAWADLQKTQWLGNLYCIEPSVYESTGGFHPHVYDPYPISTWNPPMGGTNAGLRWAAYLIYKVDPYMQSTSALTRAALQLAIWEALYDYDKFGSGYADWDFADGDFRINSINTHGIGDVKTTAEGYLRDYHGQFTAGTVLHDGQDLLRIDVPEPGSLALVGLGLALGSGLRSLLRRRRP